MILHIDPEKVWQGGQRQAAYLVKGLNNKNIRSIVVCRRNSPFHRYCIEHNWEHLALDFGRRINPGTIIKIARFCKKEKIKIIHCHSSYALTLGLQVKLLNKKIRLVASRRVDFHIRGRFSGLFKYNNPSLDKLICISHNIKNICLQDGIAAEKLQVIYSGIELNRLSSQLPEQDFLQKENLPQHSILIGTIAALVYHKDYHTLIKAAARVMQKHPQALFLAFGKGKLQQELIAMCKSLGIADRFIFMGFRQDIGKWLNSFDIFTLASKYEGLGTSVLDALACGKPCVCTAGGGIPEMITNEVNGLLVPARDAQQLAAAFCRLIEHPQERIRYAAAAKESVQKFAIEKTVSAHIKLYEELLDEKL